MRSLVLLCGALALAACSDPECAPGERKVGVTCVRLARDGGVQDAETPTDGSSQDVKADSSRDAQVNGDASAELSPASDAAADGSTAVDVVSCGDGRVNGPELCDSRIAEGQPGACPTAPSCKSQDACLVAQLIGDVASCDAVCKTSPLTACKGGDGCCPSGCTSANDSDCSASCGNGIVEAGETCEPNVGKGCPTSCSPADACHPATLTGSAANCNATCTTTAITAASGASKDGCCPGATFATDQDCAGCGDGLVQAPELCDGNCPTACDDGNPCTKNVLNGSAATCNAACSYPAIASSTAAKDGACCPAGASFAMDSDCAGCGNGILEAGEQCDSAGQSSIPPCGPSCQYVNLPATLGDDRPGYYRCGSNDSVVCIPGQKCVLTVPNPGFIPDYKYSPHCEPLGGSSPGCDGPEDCNATYPTCWRNEDVGYYCMSGTPGSDSDYSVACHVNANCAGGQTCSATFGYCI